MRAFIFSLDAFVAFSLALIAIYSLIFFSSIPSSYYFLLTQGHYLSRDALMTLTTSMCNGVIDGCPPESGDSSLLDNIIYLQNSQPVQKRLVYATVGSIIPPQFGYSLEISSTQGGGWIKIYDTSDPNMEVQGDKHSKGSNKMSVSSQVITFGYSGPLYKKPESVYNYNTCHGQENHDAGIITCSSDTNSNPDVQTGGSGLVPKSTAQIVRLTVFI